MFEILKSKKQSDRIVLAAVPLMAVCSTAISSLLAALIALIAVIAAGTTVSLLKPFLNGKTAPFAQITVAVGAIGILSAVCSVFASETVGELGIYLPLISVTAVLLMDSDAALNSGALDTLKNSALLGGANALFLLCSGIIRELLGFGSLFGADVYSSWFSPIGFFTTPAGGLFTAAVLAVCYRFAVKAFGSRKGAHS